ncbi:MAG: glycoside hydrolase family 9 protein [Bacteroidota bacterium]
MRTFILLLSYVQIVNAQTSIRVNQLGFLPTDPKSAVVLSENDVSASGFTVASEPSGKAVYRGVLEKSQIPYGQFKFVFLADFSKLSSEGMFSVRIAESQSEVFGIGMSIYRQYAAAPLFYLREQRCGYNAVFDTVCHQGDGIAVSGPDSGKYIETVGGYHDASDYLRFLITTSYTTGILLFSYKEYPHLWSDSVRSDGRNGSNGVPDILDEARWGLEWMLKLCPEKGKLYYQVADDRDHAFWDLPFRDSTDYGWGKGKARPVYFATGKPQGLFQYKDTATGISNIAGRTAAVFALGSWIWKKGGWDDAFAEKLLRKAMELYVAGKENPGFSESVPCKAPYRYHEKTFYDDLEWAAAELYRATKEPEFLDEAIRFSKFAADTSWMGKDTTNHYEYFPYVNLGHYELFEFAPAEARDHLVTYYRNGLNAAGRQAEKNAFNYGVPFIWVSNNLATGLATQAILYKKMTGSPEFDRLLADTRDWMLGRNPWGQSFLIGVPDRGRFPTDPHSVVSKELKIQLTGALVDGPVYGSIFRSLRGLRLLKADRFEKFQSPLCVYHDDIGDYSSNEPTIDGSASMLFVLASFSR